MEIKVEVKAKSARNQVKISGDKYIIQIKAEAKNNMANKAVVELLSNFFDLESEKIRIIKGFKSKNKTIEVQNENIST